jgi:hypothetical protein
MVKICLCVGGMLLVPGLVLAQAATVQDAQPESQKALQDLQVHQMGGLNLNELIHRANLANKRSLAEFQAEQNESFKEAVEAFRQQQKLRKQQKP